MAQQQIADRDARPQIHARAQSTVLTTFWTHAPRVLLIGLIAGAGVTCKSSAVHSPQASGESAQPVDDTRFPHALHTGDRQEIRDYRGRGLQCTDCHLQASVLAGEPARPGLRDHAPCDECHRDEFYKPPGQFCQNCHTSIKLLGDADIAMQPYPERGFVKLLASTFNHRLHLDADRIEGAVGFHTSCTDCHERDPNSRDPMLPGHKQCVRCHEEADKAKAALPMTECARCHKQRDVELARGRILITGDLKFAHSDHERDMGGDRVGCAECHADVSRSRTASDISVPAMRSCATCHEDSGKSPERVRIARCDVCHTAITSGDAPANHLTNAYTGTLPEDHTLEFRRNHSRQAASDNAKCSYCHTGVNRQSRDNCHQCHSIMRPRDHNLGWHQRGHGPAAMNERDRCATCHTGDECVACHRTPPRSHTPMAAFRLGGHAAAARMNTRSCMTCHTFENTCSNCHRGLR